MIIWSEQCQDFWETAEFEKFSQANNSMHAGQHDKLI